MKDLHDREIRNIRISVNDECNLHCYYCHHEGQLPENGQMSPKEIGKILTLSRELGMKKVKFTGGEPLLREDIFEIIKHASGMMEDVSLTTNGAFPGVTAVQLQKAGLNRINISLDTINKERYAKITGDDRLASVLDFIKASVDAGLFPVKINIVWLEDSTFKDLMETIKYIWERGAKPQVIELVDMDDKSQTRFTEVEEKIAELAVDVKERAMHRRKIYFLKDVKGELKEVEVVRPMHNTEFCANCSRLRVTSGGQLKPCLMHNEGLVDLLGPIRKGAGDKELIELFKLAINNRYPYWRN